MKKKMKNIMDREINKIKMWQIIKHKSSEKVLINKKKRIDTNISFIYQN